MIKWEKIKYKNYFYSLFRTLAGYLGPGRRLPDEPVHPRHRLAALDDGRRGGGGLRRHPPAVPPLSGGRGHRHGGGEVQKRRRGHH